jgi:hypothetical protein
VENVGTMPASIVDYSLARRAVLREYHSGRLSRFDICDAHPDLLRAARYCGEVTGSACPICDGGPLALVSYVFSDELPSNENGKVWPHRDVGPLMKLCDARLYTVEVCPDCSWNHLRSQSALGSGRRRSARKPRRASE